VRVLSESDPSDSEGDSSESDPSEGEDHPGEGEGGPTDSDGEVIHKVVQECNCHSPGVQSPFP
jgi:hypothetical protein